MCHVMKSESAFKKSLICKKYLSYPFFVVWLVISEWGVCHDFSYLEIIPNFLSNVIR